MGLKWSPLFVPSAQLIPIGSELHGAISIYREYNILPPKVIYVV